MAEIPRAFHDLLSDDIPAFLCLATLMPDGSPQITPVWFNYDGQHILINTARGRAKDKNLTARPQVAGLIMDPTTAWRWLQILGVVVESTEEGAVHHILDLAEKYRGRREFDLGGRTRVIYKIRLDRVVVFPSSPSDARNR